MTSFDCYGLDTEPVSQFAAFPAVQADKTTQAGVGLQYLVLNR